jgi:hypothetical protein
MTATAATAADLSLTTVTRATAATMRQTGFD